jgi:hypothetical protein
MAGGFILYDRDNATFQAIVRQVIAKASTQFTAGDACMFNGNGYLEQAAAQTSKIDGVFHSIFTDKSLMRQATANLTTTIGEEALYIPCRGNGLQFKTNLTGDDAPPINSTACNANTSKTTVKVTAAGLTNDYKAGTIFANGEQRTISADSVAGGVHTFTVTKPFTRAITTGDTAIVVPFSRGVRGVKLSASSGAPQIGISPAVADKSGGYVDIEDVQLNNLAGNTPFVVVSFQY